MTANTNAEREVRRSKLENDQRKSPGPPVLRQEWPPRAPQPDGTLTPTLGKCQSKVYPRPEDCASCVFQGLEDVVDECRQCRAISDEAVERVQAAASLLDVMADYGVEVAEQPDGCYLGDCPFCQEGAA